MLGQSGYQWISWHHVPEFIMDDEACIEITLQVGLDPEEAAGEAWYKTNISDSDYEEFEKYSKWLGVSL
ncbi:hypothetical protein CCACVL1_17764 [Corchorus capsularis]|uniref:Uncharacterized protein n=1 Tax=Corchorus capsularis TaxID=210143 RepID=A0A1R3HQS2_COCAP|nr:hypothetical protein CCACVL1_17764 [Corchorus capsularis]